MSVKKKDRWLWIAIGIFVILAIISIIAGCGDLMQAGGHVLNAGGETLVFVGEHLTETGQ